MLKAEEKSRLVQIARASIEDQFANRPFSIGSVTDRGLLEPRGAFVTLKFHGKLRGCIGYFESDKPLARVVGEVARKAAFEDPRFPPITQTEFQNIDLEISVLSDLTPLRNPSELRIGVHGLFLEYGLARGLLLPQVAREQGWSADQFLEAVAVKAGLPGSAWKDPETEIWSFTAEVITEEKILT